MIQMDFAPTARSMAPPMAGGSPSSRPVLQFARSPRSETWNAPSTATSRWPPRIMAKASAESKNAPPSASVIGALPALMRSQSSSPAGRGAHVEHAVLAVQDDAAVGRHVVRHRRRGADAEVDEAVARQVRGHHPGEALAREAVHGAGLAKTRSTKMQGVTIASGSSAPGATVRSTSTATMSAAVAITAQWLRAALL